MADRQGWSPTLTVVCGLPGVGKSTVSRAIANELGADVLRTDVIRKELFANPEYTSEETTSVYDGLLTRAWRHLDVGESIVLDATFKRRERRIGARDLADSVGARFRLVRVCCDEDVIERRIAERDGVSDADLDIYRSFRERFESVEMDHVVIDNSGSEAATRDRVARAFGDLAR